MGDKSVSASKRVRNSYSASSAAALQKKLAAYALAGGAALLSGQKSVAAVVHVNPPDTTVGPDDFYDLDLDGDATVDFTITHTSALTRLSVAGNGSNAVVGFAGGASNLAGSETIPGPPDGLKFKTGDLTMAEGDGGQWYGADHGFLGLRFNIGGVTGADHYGWARLSVNPDNTAILHDWAYNDVAGASIHVTPEPNSLGMLAMGAVGVAAWRNLRKRRRQAANPAPNANE